MKKLFYFDIETTGLDCNLHAIHQISGMIEIDNDVKSEFNFNVRPHENAVIDHDALSIAGVEIEDIMKYKHMNNVYKEMMSLILDHIDKYNKKDKFHLVGYNNASFDNAFLRKFFIRNGDPYFGSYFWSDSIDVMVLASNHLLNEREKLADFKLKTVAQYLGIVIDETQLHNASYDIYLTHEIYKIVR